MNQKKRSGEVDKTTDALMHFKVLTRDIKVILNSIITLVRCGRTQSSLKTVVDDTFFVSFAANNCIDKIFYNFVS